MGARPTLRSQIQEFYFRVYLPGTGEKNRIEFEAHITALSDSSNPSWNSDYDMGRADPVVNYGSMSRNIGISFIVVAISDVEHRHNYEHMRELGTLTYPIYKSGSGYNAPHVMYKVGDLLQGIGVITSLDFNWTPESPWLEDDRNKKRPLLTEVSMNIQVLTDRDGNRPTYNKGKYNYFGTSGDIV